MYISSKFLIADRKFDQNVTAGDRSRTLLVYAVPFMFVIRLP